MRRARTALVMFLLAATCAAAADDQARVDQVTPARVGDLVVAHFATSGLPGDKLLQSMRSGLVSAIDVDLTILDERDKVVGGNQVALQLGFDLWEELFSVITSGSERRFQTLEDLQTYLSRPEMMPVIPLSSLVAGNRYRVRVGLQVHPIAPSEQDRVGDVIAGENRPRREGQDQQEASVSRGRLSRFLKNVVGGRAGGEALSAWFTREDLNDETH
jgi:hypothetical protein